MILFIFGKPFLLERMVNAGIMPAEYDVIFTGGLGLWRHELPKVGFSDIPFTSPPLRQRPLLADYPSWLYSSHAVKGIRPRSPDESLAEWLDSIVGIIKQRLPLYDEIVVCDDANRRGSSSSRKLFEKLAEPSSLPPIYALRLGWMTDSHIADQFESRHERPWVAGCMEDAWANEHDVKTLFEFWWNANASVVFSELCNFLDIGVNPIISKYELMTYFLMQQYENGKLTAFNRPRMREGENLTTSKLLFMMDKWKGSGAYDLEFIGIGSPTSRVAIVEQCVERGIFAEKEGTISLTEKGRLFLDALHPKTWDPDLPFRLENWMISGDTGSMKKYIRTLFGRQLRFQRKCMNSQSDK